MSRPVLELSELFKHFPVRDALGRERGAVHAVDGVTLSVTEGEVLAIVGESGCGKSTLGRLMLWLVAPDAGTVRFRGEELGALPPAALAHGAAPCAAQHHPAAAGAGHAGHRGGHHRGSLALSWGSMLSASQRFLTQAPWMSVYPGLAVFLVVLAFNLMGDGLHDALDPRGNRR